MSHSLSALFMKKTEVTLSIKPQPENCGLSQNQESLIKSKITNKFNHSNCNQHSSCFVKNVESPKEWVNQTILIFAKKKTYYLILRIMPL